MIIGIIGLKGSGKDTVANHLAEQYNYEKDSFARSLKDATAAIFDWDRDMLEGSTTESRKAREEVDEWWSAKIGCKVTPRSVLQYLGTDVIRKNYYDGIWLATLENRIRKNPGKNIVISDVRFENEVNLIKKMNGKLIRIKRGEDPEWYQIAQAAKEGNLNAISVMSAKYSDIHVSEWDIVGCSVNVEIQNNNTVSDLFDCVDDFIQSMTQENNDI